MFKDVDIERFWSSTFRIEGSKCIFWGKGTFTGGYGRFYANGKAYPAHVVAYILAKGGFEGNFCVRHTCDNRLCVNVLHLFLDPFTIGSPITGKVRHTTPRPRGSETDRGPGNVQGPPEYCNNPRLLANIHKRIVDSPRNPGCKRWKSKKWGRQAPVISHNRKSFNVARVLYQKYYNITLSRNACIVFTCDKGPCLNPDHMRIVHRNFVCSP